MKMPQRLRKVRKHRGSRSHGWGVRKHKGKGSHGGHGKAGGHKHKWTRTVKYESNRYGKHGFKPPQNLQDTTINIGELDELADQLLKVGRAEKKGKLVTIDLDEIGIDKLLGSGMVKKQLSIKVKSISKLRTISFIGNYSNNENFIKFIV